MEIIKNDFSLLSLDGSEFEEIEFMSCIFGEHSLSNKKFEDCRFIQCDLHRANLKNTTFNEVYFQDSKLIGLPFDQCSKFLFSISAKNSDFSFSIFNQLKNRKERFERCLFKNCLFEEVDFQECEFHACDFQQASFVECNFQKASFRACENLWLDPRENQLKNAQFEMQQLPGLLQFAGIKIV